MSKNSGYLVEYIKDGQTQKGIIRHSDQHEEFIKIKKALVGLLNGDLTPRIDESGEQIAVLKDTKLLNVIGFVD